MPVWSAPPTEDQPKVRLFRWRMFQVPAEEGHTNHLVGYVDDRDARVCSPIQNISFTARDGKYVCFCTTRSGRVYELVGNVNKITPGDPSDGGYLLSRWLNINDIARENVRYIDDMDLLV